MTGHSTGGGLCSLCGTKVNNSDESQYLREQAAKAHETSEQEILPPIPKPINVLPLTTPPLLIFLFLLLTSSSGQ